MTRLRSTSAALLTATLALVGCSHSGTSEAAPRAPVRSTTTRVDVVRGESVAVHTMAYLASNPSSPVVGMFARAPVAMVVGSRFDVLVQLRPGLTSFGVWVGIPARRLTVDAQPGPGRIAVATDGCPRAGTAPCPARLVYAPTAFPVGPAPAGGVVTNAGFTLHVSTAAVQPGRYGMTLPIQYASKRSRANVLDVHDTLHVQIDVGERAPSTGCTAADLQRPARTMPAPHPLASTVVFAPGDERLDPPPPGARARIPATVAWSHLSSHNAGSGGSSALVLARFTTFLPARPAPGGDITEVTHDVLAWVLYTHAQAVNVGLLGHMGPIATADPAAPVAPCVFSDGLDAIDARNGQELLIRGGGAEPDPMRL